MIYKEQYDDAGGGDRLFYGNCWVKKIIGFFLICVGVIMLICFMPYWMWLSILGIVLIVAGIFVLTRRY